MADDPLATTSRLLLPTLVLSAFATQPSLVITVLLLIDIGNSFNTPVGIMGHISTSASILGTVFSVVMSILSIRHNHKTLLLTGLAFYVISAAGCYSATDYATMLIAYTLTGVGTAMVNPMQSTITANNYTLEQRSKVIGWTMAGTSIAGLVGSPIVSYFSEIGTWRLPFIAFMLPVALAALTLGFIGVPSGSQRAGDNIGFLTSIGMIFTSRSATACLVGTALASATWGGSLTYIMSFFRQQFGVATSWASLLLSAMALSKTGGHLWSGSLINKIGRKSFAIISMILVGSTTLVYLNIGQLWPSLFLGCVSCFVAGFQDSSLSVLSLEQVPEARGPMMSFYSASYRLGSTMGAGIGGFTLLLYNYNTLGMIFGILSLSAVLLCHSFVEDPTRN